MGRSDLAWDPVPEPGVAGYNLHYGTERGVYTVLHDVGKTNEAVLSELTPGQTYYCAVTAYDTLGVESDFSDELVFICPRQTPLRRCQSPV